MLSSLRHIFDPPKEKKDVLVTQHAKWTAERVRRGLFGQSIVDFYADSGSSIQLQESAKSNPSQSVTKQAEKTPRVLRSFAQARIQDKYQRQDVSCTGKFCKLVTTFVSWRHLYCCGTVAGQTLVPGMSLYEFFQASDSQTRSFKLLLTRSPYFSIVRCPATW